MIILNSLARALLVRRIHQSFYHWDAGRLREHQAQRVAHILRYASQHSPYYRRLRAEGWDGTLAALPVMRKSEFVKHFDEINTAGLHKQELVAFSIQQEKENRLSLFRNQYSVGLSSGTSGNKLVTVLSRVERWQYACLLWARSGIPDHIRDYRVLFALRVNNPAFMETRALGATIVYVDYTHPPETLVQLINEKRLNILAGPPSLLRMLAHLNTQVGHSIDVLISYAEVLDDAAKIELEQAFRAPVVQIYQGAEGFLGSTCRKGRLHLNEDVLLVETVETGDTIGNARQLIVTDLYRQTLPFLRYWLNDVLELCPLPCECGSSFRVIERIHGRADDIFYLRAEDGSLRYLFPDYVTRSINQAADAVLEFQAVQRAPDHIEVRLVLKPGADRPMIEQTIYANLAWWAAKVGGQLGRVVFTDQLPERNPHSHKLIRVVRRF
jgi:putative adenylate-forming enzyme